MDKTFKRTLDYFYKIQPGFKVQRFIEFPCPWIPYNEEGFDEYVEQYGEPNHREILEDEIVIDVDPDDYRDGIAHANLVEKKLLDGEYGFKRFQSGGSGHHFHLIFPELSYFFTKEQVEDVKYFLIEFILGKELIKPKKLKSHVCLFKKKLIQIEYAKHRKGGTKTLTSKNLKLNVIPIKFFTFLEEKNKQIIKMQERFSNIEQPDNLNCINFLEGKTVNRLNYFKKFDRINYRALFSLASYYKSKGYNIKEKLLEWYDTIPSDLKSNSFATVNKKQIEILDKRSNGSAGCFYRLRLLEELGIDKKICKDCPYYVPIEK